MILFNIKLGALTCCGILITLWWYLQDSPMSAQMFCAHEVISAGTPVEWLWLTGLRRTPLQDWVMLMRGISRGVEALRCSTSCIDFQHWNSNTKKWWWPCIILPLDTLLCFTLIPLGYCTIYCWSSWSFIIAVTIRKICLVELLFKNRSWNSPFVPPSDATFNREWFIKIVFLNVKHISSFY